MFLWNGVFLQVHTALYLRRPALNEQFYFEVSFTVCKCSCLDVNTWSVVSISRLCIVECDVLRFWIFFSSKPVLLRCSRSVNSFPRALIWNQQGNGPGHLIFTYCYCSYGPSVSARTTWVHVSLKIVRRRACVTKLYSCMSGVRNGHLEEPVYFSKAERYIVMKKGKA
jgi:hypothetical protein